MTDKLGGKRKPPQRSASVGPATPAGSSGAPPLTRSSKTGNTIEGGVDLQRRRDQLQARVAELQFDLGGLVYEMAIRDRIRVDVIVQRAAVLQDADAELGEVERILRLEQTSTAGTCSTCGAPHSSGAAFCWQCGQPILAQVSSDSIGA
ncbi:MAG TPA: zinc ribbon domain-containing protein [Solirubrobacteraceae bacterium]|nr:zinc ribbon domain-containing protein [Solirubrobacteraceae bacterium]